MAFEVRFALRDGHLNVPLLKATTLGGTADAKYDRQAIRSVGAQVIERREREYLTAQVDRGNDVVRIGGGDRRNELRDTRRCEVGGECHAWGQGGQARAISQYVPRVQLVEPIGVLSLRDIFPGGPGDDADSWAGPFYFGVDEVGGGVAEAGAPATSIFALALSSSICFITVCCWICWVSCGLTSSSGGASIGLESSSRIT